MRCLALEQVFAEKNIRFEYRENGEYTFYQDNPFFEKDDYSEEYKSQCKVKYEKSRDSFVLNWDYMFSADLDDVADKNELYRWINQYNRKYGYNCYLGEDNRLHSTLCYILPDNEGNMLEACRKALEKFNDLELTALITINFECDKSEPFSTRPLTEYEKSLRKKRHNECFKVVEMPSPEENIDNICQQLQAELDELKMSRVAGEIEPATAEEKIREIEDLLKLMAQ